MGEGKRHLLRGIDPEAFSFRGFCFGMGTAAAFAHPEMNLRACEAKPD